MTQHHQFHLLVDGHSVIFAWDDLRQLHATQRTRAREELLRRLEPIHDFSLYRVTVVFDGKGERLSKPFDQSRPGEIDVYYSRENQTADAVIERLVASFGDPGKIYVATDDHTERSTVESLGAHAMSTDTLHSMVEEARAEAGTVLKNIQFKSRRPPQK